MKRITLFLCALTLSALSFAQCPSIIDVMRNNGGQGCPNGFNGAKVFVTFVFPGNVCGTPPAAPTVTIFDGAVPLPPSQVSAGAFVSCSFSNGSSIVQFSYCTQFNLGPAGSLCVRVTGCNVGVVCEPGAGPTPVTLSNFIAARSGNNVNMKWATSTEVNSKEYVIQKKVGGNWVDHAVVASANRANGSSYSYTDVSNTAKGITEYRLKMVDFGGAFKLSDIRPIKGLTGASDFTVYPNPSNGTAYVALSESFDKSTVQLLDNAGRILKTETLQASGSTSFKSLTPGYYLIRVKNNVTGEVVTQKLSVIK